MLSNNTPRDSTPQRFWNVNDSYRYPIPEQPDPWNVCLKVLLEEDEARCNAWRSEMQNILTFAGLFSAVVMGFVIDSYKSLQPDPNATTNFLLAQLVTQSKEQSSPPPFVAEPSSTRVNVFWFLSLILALTTALIGITAMQWLNEYQRYSGNLTKKENFAQRQMRFEGLEKWYVPQIIAGLPLLLQSALVLFFVGLVDFLTSLGDRVLTISVMVVVAITLLFMIMTTVLPAFQCIWLDFVVHSTSASPPCPYKSAQSWAFLRIVFSHTAQALWIFILYVLLFVPLLSLYQACMRCRRPKLPNYNVTIHLYVLQAFTWDEFEHNWLSIRSFQGCDPRSFMPCGILEECLLDAALGVARLVKQYVLDDKVAYAAYHCFKQLEISGVGSPFFSAFEDGEDAYRHLVAHAISANTRTFVAKDQYDILFLQQFPQTRLAASGLKHNFIKHELELYIRVCAFLYLRDDLDISADVVEAGVVLLVPRSLTDRRGNWVHDYKAGKIYEFVGTAEKLQLLDIFATFVQKVISDPPSNDGNITKFYIHGTLRDFMYSIHCIFLDAVMTLPPSSSSPKPDQGQGKAISKFSQLIHKLATHLETAQVNHSHLALSIAWIHLSLFSRHSFMRKFAMVASEQQPGYAKSVKSLYGAFQLFRERFGDDALPPIQRHHQSGDGIGSEIMKALPEDEKQGSLQGSDKKGDGGTNEQSSTSGNQLRPDFGIMHEP